MLGGLELLHQHVVTQKVALRSRQPSQQLVLQKLQLNLEHVLLFGQFTLEKVHTYSLDHFGNCLRYITVFPLIATMADTLSALLDLTEIYNKKT